MNAIPTNLGKYFDPDALYNQTEHVISFNRSAGIPPAAYGFVQAGMAVEIHYLNLHTVTLTHVVKNDDGEMVEYLPNSVVFKGEILNNNEAFWQNVCSINVNNVITIPLRVVDWFVETTTHGPWKVHELGSPEEDNWEISVIHTDNQYGRQSRGSFIPNQKYLVWSNGGPCRYVPEPSLVEGYRKLAKDLAARLNLSATEYKGK